MNVIAVELAVGYVQLVPSARGIHAAIARELDGPLNRAAHDAGDNSSRTFASRFTAGLSGAAAGIARTATLAFGAFGIGLGALGAFGLSAAADFQQTRIAFEGILGSASKAQSLLEQLRAFAAKTPFEFPELAAASRQLLAVGFNAEDIIPIMTKLGNTAAALGVGGEAINGVVRALGQMKGKGKASAQELLQISEQVPGFSAIAAIAEKLGITTAEAFKQMEKGAIPADLAIQAILEGMEKFPGAAGAMERQSKTLNGVLSTFKDTVRDALINGLEPILPTLSSGIAKAGPAIGDALGAVSQGVADLVAGFQGIGEGPTTFMERLGIAARGLAQTVQDNWPQILAVGQTVFAAIGGVLITLADFIRDPLLPALKEIAEAVIRAAPPLLSLAKDGFKVLLAVIRPLIPIIGKLAATLIDLVGFFAENRAALTALLGPLAALGVAFGIAKTIAAFRNAILALNLAMAANPAVAIALAIGALGAAVVIAYQKFKPFRDAVDAVGRALKTAFEFVVNNWKTLGVILLAPFLPFIAIPVLIVKEFDKIVDFFQKMPGRILGFLTDLPGLLLDLGKALIGGLFEGVKLYFEVAKVFWIELPKVILGLLGDAALWLLEAGKNVVTGLFRGILAMWLVELKFFVNLPSTIIGLLGDGLGLLLDFGGKLIRGLIAGAVAVAGFIGRGAGTLARWALDLPGRIADFITEGLGQLFDVGQDIVQEIARGVRSLPNSISDAIDSLLPDGFSIDPRKFPGLPRAAGGPVTGGNIFLVGERGPELFVPRTSGTIIPNHALGGSGALVDTMNVVATSPEDVFQPLRRLQLLSRIA